MLSPSVGNSRMDIDVIKLVQGKHEVKVLKELREVHVKFNGPSGTPYEGGVWKVRVYIPMSYPFNSPSICFMNRLYHPNVDEKSGTVCLDVINQAWTPLYDLTNIFESFLPQLLTYPNPSDPLNSEAGAMYLQRPEEYEKKVLEYVRKYASKEIVLEQDNSDNESTLSDLSGNEDEDTKL